MKYLGYGDQGWAGRGLRWALSGRSRPGRPGAAATSWLGYNQTWSQESQSDCGHTNTGRNYQLNIQWYCWDTTSFIGDPCICCCLFIYSNIVPSYSLLIALNVSHSRSLIGWLSPKECFQVSMYPVTRIDDPASTIVVLVSLVESLPAMIDKP